MKDDECALPWTLERGAMLEHDLDEHEALDYRAQQKKRMKAWEQSFSVRHLLHLMDPTFFGADSKEARSFSRRPPPGWTVAKWETALRKTGHLK